ncbi:MAG: hypothetical protein ACTSXK_11280 [Promethearchaeota archaeon]
MSPNSTKLPPGERFGGKFEDLFGNPDPKCQYRFCGNVIPWHRQRYNAKYCCDEHGRMERELRVHDMEVYRYRKRRDEAFQFDLKNPQFYENLKNNAIEFLKKGSGKFTFRLLWEYTRYVTGIGINNNFQNWFREKLERDLNIEFKSRSKGDGNI